MSAKKWRTLGIWERGNDDDGGLEFEEDGGVMLSIDMGFHHRNSTFYAVSARCLAHVLPVSCSCLAAGGRARLCTFDSVKWYTIFRAEHAPLPRKLFHIDGGTP